MRWSGSSRPPDGLDPDQVLVIIHPGRFAPTRWGLLQEKPPSATPLRPDEVLVKAADGDVLSLPGRSLTVVRPEPFLEPEGRLGHAQWLQSESGEVGHDHRHLCVGTFIPPTLRQHCYLLLHPWRNVDEPQTGSPWRTVAREFGSADPRVLVENAEGPEAVRNVPGYLPPLEGEIEVEAARGLLDALSAANGSSRKVFAAVWDGWADLPTQWIHGAGSLTLAHSRQHLLFRGDRSALLHDLRASEAGLSAVPGVWWPEDQTWIVHSDLDFPWSFVGSHSPVELDSVGSGLELLETEPGSPADRALHRS